MLKKNLFVYESTSLALGHVSCSCMVAFEVPVLLYVAVVVAAAFTATTVSAAVPVAQSFLDCF